MDRDLMVAAAESYAALLALQRDALARADQGQGIPAELQRRLREAEAAHDEAEARLMRHVEGR